MTGRRERTCLTNPFCLVYRSGVDLAAGGKYSKLSQILIEEGALPLFVQVTEWFVHPIVNLRSALE